jgi:hypothetical protein
MKSSLTDARPTMAYVISVVLSIAAALVSTSWLAADNNSHEAEPAQTQRLQLVREGTQLVDEPGQFIAVANRLTFVSSSGVNFMGLENLNLERVGKIVGTSSESVDWFVTGTVTEYQGANYLLISRARRKAATPRQHRRF